MELNLTKCKEMLIDFGKKPTVIPPLETTSACYIAKKAVKNPFFL